MNKNNSFAGLILIVVGIIVLLLRAVGIKLFEFGPSDFWVFIVLLIGLSFELGFFLTGKAPGLLIPGGIFTTIGLLFLFEVGTDWNFAAYTWPIYIIAVAVGLLQMYLFSRREKGLLISGLIVGGVGAFFMACMIFSKITSIFNPGIFIPIALIAAGVAIFFSGSSFRRSRY